MIDPKRLRLTPVMLGIICWALVAVSAALPPFDPAPISRGTLIHELRGWVLLCFGFYGPWGVIDGKEPWGAIAWLANPCLFFATVLTMSRRYRAAIPFGAAAVAFALTSFKLPEIQGGDLTPHGKITGYEAGFFLWLSSMTLSFAAPTYLYYLSRGRPQEKQGPQRPAALGPATPLSQEAVSSSRKMMVPNFTVSEWPML
jgi:hypothetical protein